MNRNILITGASGFVGSYLSNYLHQNNWITNALSLRNNTWPNQINNSSVAYIHLAGKAHDLKNVSDEKAYFDVNTVLTKKLFDKFMESDAHTFIYFSSVKAAADKVDGILTEYETPRPETAYGKSKLAAEQYILSQKLQKHQRVIVIRPCMIHGPGNKGNLNLLYQFVAKGIPYPLAAYHNERSFLGIDNLCFVMEKMLMDESLPSGIYNLADDGALSTNELVRIIADTISKQPRLLQIPKGVMNGIAKVGDVLKLPLNSDRIQKLTEHYRVSNEKIKKVLEIDKMPISIEEGLRKTIASFINK